MKKIMFLVAVEAIAFAVAVNFGVNWLMFLIGLVMLLEYCYLTVYESNLDKDYFERQMKRSKKMLAVHALFCAVTLILAGALGFLDGYDMTVEEQVGNTFEYNTVHIDGIIWWYLIAFLIGRCVLQLFIEKAIKENIALAERRERYVK